MKARVILEPTETAAYPSGRRRLVGLSASRRYLGPIFKQFYTRVDILRAPSQVRYLTRRIFAAACAALMLTSASACQTAVSTGGPDPTYLPFLKNSANECYYLDEFMPVPDGLVSGKAGALDLRYYSYKLANYKVWRAKEIMLSFYSRNGRCWSLFEEYYIGE